MGQEDRLVSSMDSHLSINFRTSENDEETLGKLRKIQQSSINNIKDRKLISLDLHDENGAAFVYLQTNLNKKPLKLLVDTGASITILANSVVTENVKKTNFIVNLYGIVGKDVSVKTQGIVHGIKYRHRHRADEQGIYIEFILKVVLIFVCETRSRLEKGINNSIIDIDRIRD